MKTILNIGYSGRLIWVFIFSALCMTSFGQKINGLSISGPSTPELTKENFENLKSANANWVGIVPEKLIYRESLEFRPDSLNEHWSETIEATIESIKYAQQTGLKVFIKPHVVLDKKSKKRDKTRGADWRGDIKFSSEEDWTYFESNYEAYVLELAKIAQTYDVELFGIGTELKKFVSHRPQFWFTLIQKVKSEYSGKITYCANWDEYDQVPFWEQLDYIGVDMYFPISRTQTPAIGKTKKKWKPIVKKLESFSKEKNKQLLFTEFGYRNVPFSGQRPWTHDKGKNIAIDYRAQYNLYEAIFASFWDKSWVAGGFAWKWFTKAKSGKDTTFSVQGKPAFQVLKKWFGEYPDPISFSSE